MVSKKIEFLLDGGGGGARRGVGTVEREVLLLVDKYIGCVMKSISQGMQNTACLRCISYDGQKYSGKIHCEIQREKLLRVWALCTMHADAMLAMQDAVHSA